MLVGVLVGIVTLSWDRIGQLFPFAAPRTTNIDLSEVEAAFARGDLDEAIALARQFVEENPDTPDGVVWLARALIYRSYTDYDRGIDRQSALEVTAAAFERLPRNPTIMAIHAYTLNANGQAADAARIAQRALEREPEHPLAHIAIGLAYGGVGSFEIALREVEQAVTFARRADAATQMDAHRALAISYSDLGRYAEAITSIQRAIQLYPRLVPLHFERALYGLQIGDADAATVAYFQILAFDPDNAKARLRLCEVSSMLRQRETAIRFCSEVTQLAPNWSEGWYLLGREHFLQSDFATAQAYLHTCTTLQVMQAIPVEERRFECWYLQGQAAEIVGDCEGLLATYNEFRAMAASAALPQTWNYPPEGPPGCADYTPAN